MSCYLPSQANAGMIRSLWNHTYTILKEQKANQSNCLSKEELLDDHITSPISLV